MKKCNDNPELAREVNTQSIINVLNNAENQIAKHLFISVPPMSMVGNQGFYP